MSQIGYMFFACGLHAYSVAILLLVMHAFYKALLFMGAGSVMHALHGETDLKRIRGLRVPLPFTFACFVVGWLAISGVPPLSGFFAKDQILAPVVGTAPEGHHGLSTIWLALIAVAVAALGIALGWVMYGVNRIDWVALRVRLGALHSALRTGWFFDQIYSALFVWPGKAVA